MAVKKLKRFLKGLRKWLGVDLIVQKKKEKDRNLILFDRFEPSTHLQILSQTHDKLKLLT